MVTVGADGDDVERQLRSGLLRCPCCSGVLTGWGHARPRVLRGADGPVEVRPRRSRCGGGCGRTHVLLPVVSLLRRADAAAVIAAALAAKAVGAGFRWIAAASGRPAETVRGWLRRFGGRVEAARSVFTRWLRVLAADPVMPEPAGTAWADAVAAIAAAATAAAQRFALGAVAGWEFAVAVSGGRLLAPGWPAEDVQSINTS